MQIKTYFYLKFVKLIIILQDICPPHNSKIQAVGPALGYSTLSHHLYTGSLYNHWLKYQLLHIQFHSLLEKLQRMAQMLGL